MTRLATATMIALAAAPAFAAEEGPFFSLRNSEFVVGVAFLIFVGVLIYLGVPGKVAGMLDARAEGIRTDLNEARLLREEAKTLLASYEAKQKEVQIQSARIVATAKEEALAAAKQAKADLQGSIARRMAAAEEQIASTVKAAELAVRNQAISVSVAVAADVLKRQMTADQAAAAIDASIQQVAAKLH
ncbi:ATP F0F1 synthase subunit B [bacterium]|nr:ATP F0F1 synthase subunit B [bacterium]